ncbi:SIR2 family protein [Patescibacteria group bacterium]
MKISKNILLTGAGFTKNFGGSLATEMWSNIFNCPNLNSSTKVKNLLRNNFDFEEVYWLVMTSSEYTNEDKEALQKSIHSAYKGMEQTFINYSINGYRDYGVDFNRVMKFFSLFNGKNGDTGIHFTLNQDLFCERTKRDVPFALVGKNFKDYREQIESKKIDYNIPFPSPSQEWIEEFKSKHLDSYHNDHAYIKLHGSFGWISADGSNQMVLGRNKKEDIEKEPILKFYYEIFNNAIKIPGGKLMIIGYGFHDDHINEILREGVEEGLKLYIISPSNLERTKKIIHNNSLWNNVEAYYPYTLKEIFPDNNSTRDTTIFKEIIEIFTT